jgi:predicted transcriptional regulator
MGELERTVMTVLWAADAPLTVREVLDRLSDRKPAYTTVMTVLDRLARKRLVRRTLVSNAWQYTAASSREQHIAALMLDALDLAGSREAALVHFARSVNAAEARALREALADNPEQAG